MTYRSILTCISLFWISTVDRKSKIHTEAVSSRVAIRQQTMAMVCSVLSVMVRIVTAIIFIISKMNYIFFLSCLNFLFFFQFYFLLFLLLFLGWGINILQGHRTQNNNNNNNNTKPCTKAKHVFQKTYLSVNAQIKHKYIYIYIFQSIYQQNIFTLAWRTNLLSNKCM